MKRSKILRLPISFLLVLTLLLPTTALAIGNGKKYFKTGMKHEIAEEWDKAAEAFAMAVNESPRNPEYRLHLRRALFNASQMYMKKGRLAVEEKDYEAAYIAFRKAYAFDPVNELAKAEMAKMIRLQESLKPAEQTDQADGLALPTAPNAGQPEFQIPQRLEKLRDVSFPSGVNLQFIVKELAKDIDLNVLFDSESRLETHSVRIDLKSVSSAKALDYILLQENLFFERVGPRTVLIARSNRRTNFQQLVLRTFYLANANPKDVKPIIQTAIPAQPGRAQTLVLEDAATNSITIRDTQENIRLIGKLIESLDKDRAEVVMDVAIYEVNKTDLLTFGNQIGNSDSLLNIGGAALPFVRAGATGAITGGMPFPNVSSSGFAIGLPVSSIAALQTKGNTKLLASTQIHAFNNEDSSARIGQRVPVQSASYVQPGGGGNTGIVSDVYNYEQVGLTLKFKPIVFPNQDVQVAMEIESKDVATGGTREQPIFTERSIKGTARVQNNKTLLLASVAQDVESRSRSGLPLLGLIPILGRLFTAPTRDNRQVDIVIAITPRVIRAPAILPEDETERPTGSIAVPTSGSLEAMIIQEEREEYFASLRRLPSNTNVQLPDQKLDPGYVANAKPAVVAAQSVLPETSTASAGANNTLPTGLKPIDTSVRSLQINPTSQATSTLPVSTFAPLPVTVSQTPDNSSDRSMTMTLPKEQAPLSKGQRVAIPVFIEGKDEFKSAVVGLRFEQDKVAVRSVSYGDVFGTALAGSAAMPFLNKNGRMYVSMAMPQGSAESATGVIAFIEIEALVDGVPTISFDNDVVNIITADGKSVNVRF